MTRVSNLKPNKTTQSKACSTAWQRHRIEFRRKMLKEKKQQSTGFKKLGNNDQCCLPKGLLQPQTLIIMVIISMTLALSLLLFGADVI